MTVKVTTWLMALFVASNWFLLWWHYPVRPSVMLSLWFCSAVASYVLQAYWEGKNWARKFVMVTCILVIAKGWELEVPYVPLEALIWAGVGFGSALTVYLNSREARTFFGALYQERPVGGRTAVTKEL
jgi:hypothetical protein